MNAAMKKAARKASGIAALTLVTVGHAMAAPGAGDLTNVGVEAIENLKGTATTYITAAFGVAILVAGGFWGITMMKKAFAKSK